MKLFKKEIIFAIKLYIKELAEQSNSKFDEDEIFDQYLSKYSKNKKKTTGYMMFVKEMHKKYDMEEKLDKIKFIDKDKFIGDKWRNLPENEKKIYESIAGSDNTIYDDDDDDDVKNKCRWINEKNDKKCLKKIYDEKYSFCKKHYKVFMKKKTFLENKQKETILYNNYKDSEVIKFLYNDITIYKDIYNRLYSIDKNNDASCIGYIENEKVVLYDIGEK